MEILTVSDAARICGVSAQTIRQWDRTGRLRALRTPRGLRVFVLADVERVARERGK